ncbi:hypothetical protein PM082_015722 [Marasmius tenuissimus]|nr:hypothetical protein PM082_015722 [Marasmius tenuissimus]
MAENGPAKWRGELYGNRIPSLVKSHTTGPAGSDSPCQQGHMRGVDEDEGKDFTIVDVGGGC